MKIEIPFDKDVFRKQMLLSFSVVWKANLKKNRRRLIWIVLSFFTGLYVYSTGDMMGLIFFFLAMLVFINFINYEWFYQKNKKKYLRILSEISESFENAGQNTIWEFEEDHLGYKDHRFETRIKWSAFKNYRIIDNNLFIYSDTVSGNAFVIGLEEVELDIWNNIKEIVAGKLSMA
nr:hypothetical protein [uncultured Carboxylicivirga sp.]